MSKRIIIFRIVFKNIFEDPEDFEKFKDMVVEKNPSNYINTFNVGMPDYDFICARNYKPNAISFIVKIPKSNILSFFDATDNPLSFNVIREHGGSITELHRNVDETNTHKHRYNDFTNSHAGIYDYFKTKIEKVIGTSDAWGSPLRYGSYWVQETYRDNRDHSWTFNGYTVSSFALAWNSNYFIQVYGNLFAGVFSHFAKQPHMLVTCNYYLSNNAHSRGYGTLLPSGRLLYKGIDSMELIMPGNCMPNGTRPIFRDKLQHFDLTCPNDDFMYFLGWVEI